MSGPQSPAGLDIPRGTLVRSRVGVAGALEAALTWKLTGYARIEPDSLLADGHPGVLTFDDGVPRAAYCTRGDENGTADTDESDSRGVDVDDSLRDSSGSEGHGPSGREGQSPSGNRASPGDNRKPSASGDSQSALRSGEALAAFAGPGPCTVELYDLPEGSLTEVHDASEFTVPPGAPAEELADDPGLAERARERAPDDAPEGGASALELFLEDEERIAAIQEEARAEAEERAAEWGLDGELADSGSVDD